MSFYNVYKHFLDFDFTTFFSKITEDDILRVLAKDKLSSTDYLTLLSPTAEGYLEQIAEKASKLSLMHFGKAILLYTPIYISNYCVNKCIYCSFNHENKIKRKKMTIEEIEIEAAEIAKTGLKHILILTGESSKQTPVSYIKQAISVLKRYFESIAIEIYPLNEDEYAELISVGLDGLTIYQEVYDEKVYDKVHVAGPKKNYLYRLDAAERACRAKIRGVNIGALLGLADWHKEAFFTGLHAKYLQDEYSDVEVSISLPRIRPHIGSFNDIYEVTDKALVQILLAHRIFTPYAGITISTRERERFRDNLIPLGITKMSAGVSTEVGGHTSKQKGSSQFEISDIRSVEEIKRAILDKGYQPILKDWMKI